MRGRAIRLSRPRRFIGDLMHFAQKVPTVPVQRSMQLTSVVQARNNVMERPSWPAIFLKAYSIVSDQMPVLRRAYLTLPWEHIREYPSTVASLTIERNYEDEPGVFFARISKANELPLTEIHTRIRHFAEDPIETIRPFRKMLAFAKWPRVWRRMLFWLGLNLPGSRAGKFGTFGLSVYSSLGAESLHPLSPLTTTLNYGVIDEDGMVNVRLVYDHRVMDGATVARALIKLEEVLNGPIVDELHQMANDSGVSSGKERKPGLLEDSPPPLKANVLAGR